MLRSLKIPAGITIAAIAASWSAVAFTASLGLPSEPQGAESEAPANARQASDSKSLRICAARKQPPLSLEDGSGLENKIGAALAEAMALKPQFVWSDRPAIYIVRDYLDKKLCDVVIGLDTGDPRVATSMPYYRSGYVFITRADSDLDMKSWSDPRIAHLGHVVVPFGSPAEVLLKDKGLYEEDMAYLYSLVNFRSARNEYTQIEPSRLVSEVASGSAGAAVGFAPDVARYVKSSPTPLRMTLIEDDAVKSSGEKVAQRFDQSVGVRREDASLLQQVNTALTRAKPKIDAILQADGVPLLPVAN
ncbi:methanol oxidation system protein MoxJ [Methylocystis bryophila]|uniref:Methanol oxidation system protein MoxJ n=1 Tax=Methylocystis bryophila TaxID=655015 RepID=A0A1W6MSB9_9HYPH|nr:methanol oxidation system protein MoxJ [Methylocystis bryophila]ARN80498.1 methanol oxidation system protein MoxJ [Methylocystis bryophila]BDV40527.1 amino acid ABC transporter substrate-binding protein [Methylocystis bryophila]